MALGEAEFGVLRLSAGEPFPVERVVLWLGVQNLAFSLVCDMHENLLLAEGTLRNLARHCMEELRLLGPGSEVRQHSQHQQSWFSVIIIIFITVTPTYLIYLIFNLFLHFFSQDLVKKRPHRCSAPPLPSSWAAPLPKPPFHSHSGQGAERLRQQIRASWPITVLHVTLGSRARLNLTGAIQVSWGNENRSHSMD